MAKPRCKWGTTRQSIYVAQQNYDGSLCFAHDDGSLSYALLATSLHLSSLRGANRHGNPSSLQSNWS